MPIALSNSFVSLV